MNAAASERLELEHELRTALAGNQFEVHYQPQTCANDGHLCGVEALVRWRHPQRGMIPPLKFIPIAEETGLIEALGAWVLDEACRQLAAWHREGMNGVRMAVNLSAHQLRSTGLVDLVRKTLHTHALGDGDLELEITESVAMSDPERAIKQLQALRALGVQLAIDDFGTGYSSLAYLKRLPIQVLKLDREFVRDIETDANDAAISAATLALAHSLGLKVVAEGVETSAQRDFLVAHQCDVLQGFGIAKPMPGAELSEWAKTWNPDSAWEN
jgi:EAL domain-containing protein (putative c-di-GMP-specific phosphodiesterase class I)